MKEFAVRKMVSDDLDQIHAIEKDAFPDLFPPSSFSAELKRPRAEYFVAHSIKNIESLQIIVYVDSLIDTGKSYITEISFR